MASTEAGRRTSIEPLSAADVDQALELSASAHWNQNRSDWLAMLSLGEGFGIRAPDEQGRLRLAASVIVLPYGGAFAWVSMVLVLPAFQRRGYASMLLRHALKGLHSRGMFAVLDATPAGHAVYLQEGFVDTWGFARYRREASTVARVDSPTGPPTRALRESDWPEIAALDAPAFGANRLDLLHTLARRWPQAARVLEQDSRVRGVLFGRDGREAHQLGPLLADDAAAARGLIADALPAVPGAAYIDLLDERKVVLLPWLEQQGFTLQRPFTRMLHGASIAPGDTRRLWAVAGPELG